MIKSIQKFILGSIAILLAILVVITLVKPEVLMDLVEVNKKTLIGKCLAREAVENPKDLEAQNMLRMVHITDTDYITLTYQKPSLMNQFEGSYMFEIFGKKEKINNTLLIDFVEVPCKSTLKIKAFKLHRDFSDAMDSVDLKEISEDDKGLISVKF